MHPIYYISMCSKLKLAKIFIIFLITLMKKKTHENYLPFKKSLELDPMF